MEHLEEISINLKDTSKAFMSGVGIKKIEYESNKVGELNAKLRIFITILFK